MKSIKSNVSNELVITKSKFITYLFKVNNTDDIDNYMKEIKDKYKDATHHCYAYILDNIKKCSDDKEPSGTAGMPILNVLEHNELTNILAIVVRYFGGTKLGTGGLTHAYSDSIVECLKKTSIIEIEKGYLIEIKYPYEKIKEIDYLLKDYQVKEKVFDSLIESKIFGNDSLIDLLKNNKIDYQILDNLYIEKVH